MGLDPSSYSDDAAATTATTYDRNGNAVTQIQNQRRTTYTYGSGATTNLLVSESIGFVSGGADMSASFTYDSVGNLATIVRNAGKPVRTELSYDAGNHLTRIQTCVLPANDVCSAPAAKTVQDIAYTFDVTGNIRVKRQQFDQVDAKPWAAATAYAVGDTIDGGNGHQYLVLAGGTTPADPGTFAAGLTLPIGDGASATGNNVTLQEFTTTTKYAYDAQNRLVSEDRPNNPTSTSDYDRTYVYDAEGRLDRIENASCTSGSAVAEQYHYSAVTKDQLLGTEKWDFAPSSGACVRTLAADTDITFGSQGSSQEGAMTSITIDNASSADHSIDLDQGDDNLLAAVTVDGDTSAITRDDQGRILQKASEASGDSTQFTYAGDDRAVSTVQEGAAQATGVLTAPNGWVIAEQRDPAGYSRYLLTDHLGTAVAEFGKSGAQQSSYAYDAYGQVDELQTSGEMDTTVGFTGQQVDPTTGFTNNDARQYDPVLRTWITTDQYTDPAEDLGLATDPLNANRLQYAGGNPVNSTDPDGHMIRQGNNIIQITRGKAKIITVDGKNRGRSSSAAATAASRARSAFEIKEARIAATKAKWAKNKNSTAYKEAHCSRALVNGRCMTVAQERTYKRKLAGARARPKAPSKPKSGVDIRSAVNGAAIGAAGDISRRTSASIIKNGISTGASAAASAATRAAGRAVIPVAVAVDIRNNGVVKGSVVSGSSLAAGAGAAALACPVTAGAGCAVAIGALAGLGTTIIINKIWD